MNKRITKLKQTMKDNNIDTTLIFKSENRRYLSNFTGSTGFVVFTDERNIFATDFRYMQQANSECKDFEIIELSKDFTINDLLIDLNTKNLGVEENFITLDFANTLKKHLSSVELISISKLIDDLRIIKDKDELSLISKAAEITDNAFSYILDIIKPGMSEKEISLELEYFMKKNGAQGPSFNFIVASGKRSSLPHGVASDKKIEVGDFVTIDMGCIYNGYCSDMTRTIVIGKASDKQKEIYNIVLKAQEEALNSIKPGITGYEIDKIARDIITENDYGKYFGHGLGHGVGLEVHESPRLSPHDVAKAKLSEGMVVTDEPGIYIPDFGGVRIEDLIVVTDKGFEVLSKSTKKLIELDN